MLEHLLINKNATAIDVSVLTVPAPRFAGQAKATASSRNAARLTLFLQANPGSHVILNRVARGEGSPLPTRVYKRSFRRRPKQVSVPAPSG
jgi:hypothetical protein